MIKSFLCPGGEIGRHKGLKIPRRKLRAGSSPALGTKNIMKKITVVGCGYVGYSIAIAAARKYEVKILDIDEDKINKVNQKQSPIDDCFIHNFLKNNHLNLEGSTDKEYAYQDAELVFIATPTNYDEKTN